MIITIFWHISNSAAWHDVIDIMDVLGGGYTPTFGELGEEEKLIINSSGNIKVTFKLRAPFNLFFLWKSKNCQPNSDKQIYDLLALFAIEWSNSVRKLVAGYWFSVGPRTITDPAYIETILQIYLHIQTVHLFISEILTIYFFIPTLSISSWEYVPINFMNSWAAFLDLKVWFHWH